MLLVRCLNPRSHLLDNNYCIVESSPTFRTSIGTSLYCKMRNVRYQIAYRIM